MRHKFIVLAVKRRLISVYIYGSRRKIKTGVSLFWTTRYTCRAQNDDDDDDDDDITKLTVISYTQATPPILPTANIVHVTNFFMLCYVMCYVAVENSRLSELTTARS